MSYRNVLKPILLLALAFEASSAFAGNGVGNGGLAYVCRDLGGKIKKAELLDLWEPETYKIERSNAPIEDQIAVAVRRITIRFPGHVEILTKKVADMRSLVLFTDRVLAPTEDALPNFLPESGCKYEQVARYAWVNDLGKNRLLINREIYDSPAFSNTDRAALYVHETLYEFYTTRIQYFRNFIAAEPSVRTNIPETFRAASLPLTSQIVRQIVQAAFWRENAVSLRPDLIAELVWILPNLNKTKNAPLTTLKNELSLLYLPTSIGTCIFRFLDPKTSEELASAEIGFAADPSLATVLRQQIKANRKVRESAPARYHTELILQYAAKPHQKSVPVPTNIARDRVVEIRWDCTARAASVSLVLADQTPIGGLFSSDYSHFSNGNYYNAYTIVKREMDPNGVSGSAKLFLTSETND